MANEITATVKYPSGFTGPKTFLQASVHTYTTASDSGIAPGHAVCITAGNAAKACADSANTLAVGLVSKVISTTQCEVMTAGVLSGYSHTGVAAKDVLYLDPTTPGALTKTMPSGASQFVQVVAIVTKFASPSTCELELRVGGLSDTDSSNITRLARAITAAPNNNVGFGLQDHPVTTPRAALHVVGDMAVSYPDGPAILTLSRYMDVPSSEDIGRVTFAGSFATDDSPTLGTTAATVYARASSHWEGSPGTANLYLNGNLGYVSILGQSVEAIRATSTAVSLKKNTAVTGTLAVSSDTVLSGTLTVAGDNATSLESTLDVTGATTLSSTLDVAGVVTIGGGYGGSGTRLDAAGNVQADGFLIVDGYLTVGGGYNDVGTTISTGGNIQTSGFLTVDGSVVAKGKAVVNSTVVDGVYDFYVAGSSLFGTGLSATRVQGDLTVTGATDVTGDLSTNGQLDVGGGYGSTGATIGSNGDIQTNGAVTVLATGAYPRSRLYVSSVGEANGLVDIYSTGNLGLWMDGHAWIAGGVTPFTGAHILPVESVLPQGSVVCLVGGVAVSSTSVKAKNCVGIVVKCYTGAGDSLDHDSRVGLKAMIASVGDNRTDTLPGFLVCNENGPIAAGDLLCTSSTPGHLMKQDDDIIRAYTVGKAMQDVVFDESGKASGVYGYIYCG